MLAAGVLAFTAAACGSTSNTGGAEKKVLFEVTGPSSADITYMIGTNQSQDNDVKVPWKKELTSKDDPLIAVVTAQSKASGSGEITCKISIDGKEVKTGKSTGEFAVVTCSNG